MTQLKRSFAMQKSPDSVVFGNSWEVMVPAFFLVWKNLHHYHICWMCEQRCKCWSHRPKMTSSVISDVTPIIYIYIYIFLCSNCGYRLLLHAYWQAVWWTVQKRDMLFNYTGDEQCTILDQNFTLIFIFDIFPTLSLSWKFTQKELDMYCFWQAKNIIGSPCKSKW